jgi:hypothetical protein
VSTTIDCNSPGKAHLRPISNGKRGLPGEKKPAEGGFVMMPVFAFIVPAPANTLLLFLVVFSFLFFAVKRES